VLFLYADDQRADTIAAWGNPRISTPNLDRLATEGFSFRSNYNFGSNSGAVCIPSRAMVHTGRTYLHTPNDMAGVATLPQVLGDAGYHTFITGKWHNGEEALLRSYREGASIMLGGMSDHLRVPLRDVTGNRVLSGERLGGRHSSELFADAAIRFLDDYDSDDPFYVYVAFTAPHDPRQPPAEYAEPYYERLPALPENFLPQHPFDNGAMAIRDERLASWPRTEADVQDQLAEYYGLITHLDGQVGRILNALADSPHAERTLIIYAADHGLAVGSHGLLGKQNLYEHSVRSPLIVSGPGIPTGETWAFTYLLDLVPTVAELTGAGMPHDVDGYSLRALWEGADERVRDAVFLAYQDTMRALRDEQYKIIVYPQINHRQLFDLSRDPDETRDLSTDVEYRPVLDRMLTRLNLAQQSFGDTQPLEVDDPDPRDVDLSGQDREPDRWQPAWIVDKYFR
jgi:arylsulfatase A-like enzyme